MKKAKNWQILLILFIFISILPQFGNFGSIDQSITQDQQQNLSPKTSDLNGGGYIMDTDATYSWIDITGTGTNTTLSDTYSGSETINFPTWNFTFYETNYSKLHVSDICGWTHLYFSFTAVLVKIF